MYSIDTGTDELLCHIYERVATITLNKPQKKNALGDILTPALRETIAVLENDNRVGSILITGAEMLFALEETFLVWAAVRQIVISMKYQKRTELKIF